MSFVRCSFVVLLIGLAMACNRPAPPQNSVANTAPGATPGEVEVADHFAYPIGKTETVTQTKDKDDWYNELEFGKDGNLGENWTFNAGGNSACGEPAHAVANGVVTYADFAGPEWGSVVIIDHQLPSGEKVQTLYGHLMDTSVKAGTVVKKRDQIGTVGNANGRYLCHLHFEIRTPASPFWGKAGPMTSSDKTGFLDPSDFIDAHR
jgi:murein DD-endopeptidase MepM/ murein hydrolase activator NlpD